MTGLIFGGLIAASLTMTYFFCIRPMQKGRCATQDSHTPVDIELDLALKRTRLILEQTRAVGRDVNAPPMVHSRATDGPNGSVPERTSASASADQAEL